MKYLIAFISFLISINVYSQTEVVADRNIAVQTEPFKTENQVDLDSVIKKALVSVVSKIESTKGRVAVMDFPSLDGKTTGLSAYISNKTANKLIEASRQVVDRATLEKVISEQKLQQNALMDVGTAAKIGKLAGAGVFIIGNYTYMTNKFVLTIRALSVESGQFIPGAVSEETVKPIPAEMIAEINELSGVVGVKTSELNLEGSVNSNEVQQEQISAEILVLNKELCKIINKGIDFGKLIKVAHKAIGVETDEHGEPPYLSGCSDSIGEGSHGSSICYQIGEWFFELDGSLNKNDLARGIKGKAIQVRVKRWFYQGSVFPGVSSCAPEGSEWNEKRGSSKIGAKTKK